MNRGGEQTEREGMKMENGSRREAKRGKGREERENRMEEKIGK